MVFSCHFVKTFAKFLIPFNFPLSISKIVVNVEKLNRINSCAPSMVLHSSQIVLQTISDSFAPQEVIPFDIRLQRVWTRLPVLDAWRISFLPQNKTPVNFLDLGSTFSCASTSPQVSPWLERVVNLTQNLFSLRVINY